MDKTEDLEKLANSLYLLSEALATAVDQRFMAPAHGANVWKNALKNSGLDVAKTLEPEKHSDKGGE